MLNQIATALKAKDNQTLKVLQIQLKRKAWLTAWQEQGSNLSDFIETPNPFIRFVE